VRIARQRGFGESMHVTYLGLTGQDVGAVLACAVDRGYVLVTNNFKDFVRRIERVEIHAGLGLDMPDQRKSRALQAQLFERALEEIGGVEPLNEVVVLIAMLGHKIAIERYLLPE
jgi:hypothetical protein